MGYSTINLHIKVNTAEDELQVKKYFDNSYDGAEDLMEDIPEEFKEAIMKEMGLSGMDEQMNKFVSQPGYLSVCSKKVKFDNFERIAEDVSKALGLDVMVVLVFDSDIAVIQGYAFGRKILEEVNSVEEKKKMNRKLFIQRFAPNCTQDQIASVWDKEIDVFAEDILYEMGEIMGIKLLLS